MAEDSLLVNAPVPAANALSSAPRRLKLAVLISGGGTTLSNLLEWIRSGRLAAEVVTVIASRPDCGGIAKAQAAGLPCSIVQRRDFADVAAFSAAVFELCREAQVELVLCGGFLALLQVPSDFSGRVMNIHPSLIPAFAGKGFHGHHVHQAVLDRGCKVSGCTVHFVDDQYDHGPIVLQRVVPVLDEDTAETLAARVFTAECEAFPEAVQLFAQDRLRVVGHRVHIRPE